MRLGRTATRESVGEEERREGGIRRDKNPLTADMSISKDGGNDTALYFFKHGTENQVVQQGLRERRKKGGWRDKRNRKLMGKVIAVSTWSIA